MPRLSQISGIEMTRILENLGFEFINRKGSHLQYKHPDGRSTTVVDTRNKKLSRILIKKILNQIDISRDEYERQCEAL